MKKISTRSLVSSWLAVALATIVTLAPQVVSAKGGSGGGGSTKVTESRVTGYVTAIDYVNMTIQVGASYYGSGLLTVDSNTDISLDNTSCGLDTIQLGQWCEARFVYSGGAKTATKLTVTSVPTS